MTNDDIPLGMRLKTEAGWNQTDADWHRMLALEPNGCFVAEIEGRPVGTTTTCVFDSIGWIAMVLVEKTARGQGVGTALMRYALDYLDARGVSTARLDATSLGRPIYERLGFVAEYELARWTGTTRDVRLPKAAGPIAEARWEGIYDLDRRITGTNRRRLLERFFGEHPESVLAFVPQSHVEGYTWIRPGERFSEIGPAVSLSEISGLALLDAAAYRCNGTPILIDIPVDNRPAMQWAESHGLAVQRTFTRMSRGELVRDVPARLWASSGPEKG